LPAIILPHDLKITDFHLTLELAMKSRSEIALVYWEQRRSELQDSVRDRNGEHLSINPDAFFGIKNAGKPEEESTCYYFLEIVRARESDYQPSRGASGQGSVGESYLIRKMRAFAEYKMSGMFKKAWEPLEDFRVITILPSELRALNFCRKLTKQKLVSQRLLISHFGAYSLEQPEKILGKFFWTPKDYDSRRDALRDPTYGLAD
jgi:hypothetical protein